MRKPTSDCWRDSPETPDVEEEVGLAAGAGAEAEAALGCGAADDAGGGVDDAGVADEADEAAGEDGAGEAGVATEADGAEETEDVDDAGKREEDEQAASIGISDRGGHGAKAENPAPVGDPPVNTYATPPHHTRIIPSARGQSQGAIGTPEAFTGKPIGCMEKSNSCRSLSLTGVRA